MNDKTGGLNGGSGNRIGSEHGPERYRKSQLPGAETAQPLDGQQRTQLGNGQAETKYRENFGPPPDLHHSLKKHIDEDIFYDSNEKTQNKNDYPLGIAFMVEQIGMNIF